MARLVATIEDHELVAPLEAQRGSQRAAAEAADRILLPPTNGRGQGEDMPNWQLYRYTFYLGLRESRVQEGYCLDFVKTLHRGLG